MKPTSWRHCYRAWVPPEIIRHPYASKLLLHLIMRSAFVEGPVGPDQIYLKPWQVIVSRRSMSSDLNISQGSAWRTLEFLVEQGIVARETHHKFTVITLMVPAVMNAPRAGMVHDVAHKPPRLAHPKVEKLAHPSSSENATKSTPERITPIKTGPPENGDPGHNLEIYAFKKEKDLGLKGSEKKNTGRHPVTDEPIDEDGNIIF